jgi:hypothetical protein
MMSDIVLNVVAPGEQLSCDVDRWCRHHLPRRPDPVQHHRKGKNLNLLCYDDVTGRQVRALCDIINITLVLQR